jgi:LmbE family N-acetylglucosaminyl deacetylase
VSPEIELRNGPRRLLAVLAHPDDETFGIGGTLALYDRRGVEITLICATRGEAGEVAPKYLHGYASVAELREAELRAAADKLGISEIIFLDRRDSGMPGIDANNHPKALMRASLAELSDEIAGHIRRIRPQVVITFDPYGGYGHPDHIHIQRATHIAFNQALVEDPELEPIKLYDYTIPKHIMRWMVRVMPLLRKDPRKFGQNRDIDLSAISEKDFPIHAIIDYSAVKKYRLAASACYASQGGSKVNSDAAGLLRGWAIDREYFIRAYPPADSNVHERDLFEGIY